MCNELGLLLPVDTRNQLERLAGRFGHELVIEEMETGWAITQYLDGPCFVDTPFAIGRDEREAEASLREMLTGNDEGGE